MIHYCYLTGLYSRYDVLIFERQGKSLVKAGYKVTYIVCDDKPNELRDGIEIISTGFLPRNRFERFFKTYNLLLNLALKVDADIYQVSDPELVSIVLPLQRKNKKVIFNLREFYPTMLMGKHYIPKYIRSIVASLYTCFLKVNLKKYDAVFAVTTWIVDILKCEWNLKNVHLLTNFPIVNQEYSLSYDEYLKRGDVLCYEGTIYKVSRQENVFSALQNLPNVHYLLAGKIDSSYSFIKEHPYWGNVEFIDGFELKDLKNIFAKATIANVFRDFGSEDGSLGVIKVFECMEAALPVLFADVPLYRFINDKYHCGLCVDPNNSKQIENAIKYLVEHKKEAYQMGQNGRKAVLEEFNWGKQAENYIEVISQL